MKGKERKDWLSGKLLKINMEGSCDRRGSAHQVVLLHFSLVLAENRLTPVEGRGSHMTSISKSVSKGINQSNTWQRLR